jgi:hypothetical protein
VFELVYALLGWRPDSRNASVIFALAGMPVAAILAYRKSKLFRYSYSARKPFNVYVSDYLSAEAAPIVCSYIMGKEYRTLSDVHEQTENDPLPSEGNVCWIVANVVPDDDEEEGLLEVHVRVAIQYQVKRLETVDKKMHNSWQILGLSLPGDDLRQVIQLLDLERKS